MFPISFRPSASTKISRKNIPHVGEKDALMYFLPLKSQCTSWIAKKSTNQQSKHKSCTSFTFHPPPQDKSLKLDVFPIPYSLFSSRMSKNL